MNSVDDDPWVILIRLICAGTSLFFVGFGFARWWFGI